MENPVYQKTLQDKKAGYEAARKQAQEHAGQLQNELNQTQAQIIALSGAIEALDDLIGMDQQNDQKES